MKNKVVVVTGANSGIGKMTAVGLALAGATVVMAAATRRRAVRHDDHGTMILCGSIVYNQMDLALRDPVYSQLHAEE
jgi:NAD(P)-dependent dehydrogenase (short-subunit alcohol dehydrogenase family)